MSHTSKDIIKNISIDCVVFGFENNTINILLVKRKRKPEKGEWALPGGFILKNETLDSSALRVLEETSNVSNIYLEQVQAFSEVDRFPGRRVVTISYFALINPDKHSIKPGIDTTDVQWFPIADIPHMPFDHPKILSCALSSLQKRVRYKPIGFELLPKKFTLTQLQTLYESILNIKLDKRNFRKKIVGTKLIVELDEFQQGVAHRAPRLFRFDNKNYKRLKKVGINFEI